jgi:hypothetical protein
VAQIADAQAQAEACGYIFITFMMATWYQPHRWPTITNLSYKQLFDNNKRKGCHFQPNNRASVTKRSFW